MPVLWTVYMIMHVWAHSSMQTNTLLNAKETAPKLKQWRNQQKSKIKKDTQTHREKEGDAQKNVYMFISLAHCRYCFYRQISSGFKVPFVHFVQKINFFSFSYCWRLLVSFAHTLTDFQFYFCIFLCLLILIRFHCIATQNRKKAKCCTFIAASMIQ